FPIKYDIVSCTCVEIFVLLTTMFRYQRPTTEQVACSTPEKRKRCDSDKLHLKSLQLQYVRQNACITLPVECGSVLPTCGQQIPPVKDLPSGRITMDGYRTS
ncbi:hypothetical protein L9F63_004527, partial [Diploptera punctata]